MPPKELSPNARIHWSKKVRFKNQQKDLGHALASRYAHEFTDAKSIAVSLIYYTKTKRSRDSDNLMASCKAIFDGIAMGLMVNDKIFNPITIDRGEPDKLTPRVEIFLTKKT
jgi:crossover junction endodeoxyribonuclease RusA